MSTIKTVTGLSGTESTGEWDFKRAKVTCELDLSNPKNIRGVQLSSAGVVFYKGKEVFLGIPMKELWEFVEKMEPKFLPAEEPAKPEPEKN